MVNIIEGFDGPTVEEPTEVDNFEVGPTLVADENGVNIVEGYKFPDVKGWPIADYSGSIVTDVDVVNKKITVSSNQLNGGVAEATVIPSPENQQPSPEDMAAHDFQVLLPKFWEAVEQLSMRAQARVFKALIEYPLATSFPNLAYENEKKAFYTGLQIMDCKFILQTAVFELTKNKEKLEQFKKELTNKGE